MTRNCPAAIATDHGGGEDDRDHSNIASRSPAKRPLALAPFIVMTSPPLVKTEARSHIADREKASARRPNFAPNSFGSPRSLLSFVSFCTFQIVKCRLRRREERHLSLLQSGKQTPLGMESLRTEESQSTLFHSILFPLSLSRRSGIPPSP